MSVKTKILVTSALTSIAFWIPVWLPYAASKNIDLPTAYGLIALYSALVVLLEYPTGVIGDTYSHKLSASLGYITIALSGIIMVLSQGTLVMGIGILFFALGTSLISGSDQAYFHRLTGNEYKKFYPLMKNIGLLATLVGVSSGTVLYSQNPHLPLLLNSVAFLLAFAVFSTLPPDTKSTKEIGSERANPFSIAKLGIKEAATNILLRNSLIIFAVIFAFSNNLKWLYGSILQIVELPIHYWGIVITLFYLGRFVGIQLQHKLKGKRATIALLVALANFIFILGYVYNQVLIAIVIFLTMIIIGAVETDLEIEIQSQVLDRVRSSVLSLKSLLGRGAAALYILLAGLLTTPESINKLTLATFALVLFVTGVRIAEYLKTKESQEL